MSFTTKNKSVNCLWQRDWHERDRMHTLKIKPYKIPSESLNESALARGNSVRMTVLFSVEERPLTASWYPKKWPLNMHTSSISAYSLFIYYNDFVLAVRSNWQDKHFWKTNDSSTYSALPFCLDSRSATLQKTNGNTDNNVTAKSLCTAPVHYFWSNIKIQTQTVQ